MYVVSVTVHVDPSSVQAFIEATLDNARNTRREPGNLRFDVLRSEDDEARFLLYEVYRAKEDFAAHQQTEHYQRWKKTQVFLSGSIPQQWKMGTVLPA